MIVFCDKLQRQNLRRLEMVINDRAELEQLKIESSTLPRVNRLILQWTVPSETVFRVLFIKEHQTCYAMHFCAASERESCAYALMMLL
jgi:hypothetical protein